MALYSECRVLANSEFVALLKQANTDSSKMAEVIGVSEAQLRFVLATGAVTEQVEGGQEVSQAAYLAYEASRPVTGTASRGASLFRKKAAAEAKRRIKKVETGLSLIHI